MGQVAFDTQEFVETLENAGLPKEQAKAISIAVRKSHEVADVATKQDIAEVNRNIADVRKDLSAEIADVRKDMELVRKDLSSDIALIRKDVEHIATGLLLKLGSVIVLTISAATAIIKFF
ncbi:hypothetical protein QE197_07355 [Arsenophonus nasoniae]|uniref:Conserved hypothetical phage protein n=1 Tax=Arsenophonus nasoniae TaxID=638 RepID=D2U105_9GAMM|nr:hypothetical protein [Arsenophonus nasoniae]QBY43206.1 hypothetical protein ArsFIN_17730 [Arsenophonus nasoniae]WGM07222.1 hypothetical protein QE258_08200 [Arsenophonus nasoniae]WGM12100.1 hypothetical protein QE197_07355 [Arsenophonus nasoniae]WGM16783.1 hypothetical protein QE193_07255 [Arsenophonus nasoniae]CBA74283.1 conserved hypothetical phage protein [Arsenophonus nasoniae]